MPLRCTKPVLRTFGILLAVVALLSLTVSGAALAHQDHDADKMEHHDHDMDKMEHHDHDMDKMEHHDHDMDKMEHHDHDMDKMEHHDHDMDKMFRHKKRGKKQWTQNPDDLLYGEYSSDPWLYRIGAEFDLKPEEVDEFLYLVMETAAQMHTDTWEAPEPDMWASEPDMWASEPGMWAPEQFPPESHPWNKHRDGQMRKYERRSPHSRSDLAHRNRPMLVEIVTIRRFQVDDYRDGAWDNGSDGWDYTGTMNGGSRRRGMMARECGPMLEDAQAVMPYRYRSEEPQEHLEHHKPMMPHQDMLPESHMDLEHHAEPGMLMEDLMQNEMLLHNLITMVGPLLVQAIEQGLITEDMLFQLLTLLE